MIVCVVLAAGSLLQALFSHTNWRDSKAAFWPSVILLQWLLVIPHELAHAVVARWLGYSQIRIIIGAGRPLFSLHFLGFPWLFRLIPFGGLTFSKMPGPGWRWKHLATVAAGPGINALLAGIAWFYLEPGTLFDRTNSVSKLLLVANLFVLVEALFPYVAATPFGPIQTDGLQLWSLLFRWNMPTRERPTRIPAWEVVLCYCLKWAAALITFTATLLFIGLGGFLLLSHPERAPSWLIALLLLFDLGLVLIGIWITIRLVREPIARERERPSLGLVFLNPQSLYSPTELQLVSEACQNLDRGNFAATEKVCDELLASLPDQTSSAYAYALRIKLASMLGHGAFDDVETICHDFARQGPVTRLKIDILDAVACAILYKGAGPGLAHAERLVRLALELNPGAATVKGTLGGILAENGQFSEAEPLLQQCLQRSDALHDQALASFYLGVVKLGTNQLEAAKQLFHRALTFYPEPSFTARVQARLSELEKKALP